ncbi:transcriptional regulator [Paenibacillus contaminans]|uniref:Transcriptional regulator n=2 Tax=Paenibacillus contaminans TaxID=450362 RepID=A0A329MMM0_9BACL|nr:transcriptional regulator [Paenibacillus contaminans]
MKMYRIGQLAKEAGLSIRTLRYYDEFGVLKPSVVSGAGYRYYGKEDVIRLHHITTLKQLGFTLSEIKNVLEDERGIPTADKWIDAIRMQIAEVRKEQERLKMLDRVLHTTLHTLELRGDVAAEELLLYIQHIRKNGAEAAEHFRASARRNHFTDAEIPILEGLPSLEEDDPRTTAWVKLLREVHTHRDEPPESDISMKLAAQLLELGANFFQDNYELMERYWDWVRPEPGQSEKTLGLSEDTMAYIDRIVEEYLRREQESKGNPAQNGGRDRE